MSESAQALDSDKVVGKLAGELMAAADELVDAAESTSSGLANCCTKPPAVPDELIDAGSIAQVNAGNLYSVASVSAGAARQAIANSGAVEVGIDVLEAAAGAVSNVLLNSKVTGAVDAASDAAMDVVADVDPGAAAGICSGIAGALSSEGFVEKLEIVRDFYQVLSLFLSKVSAPSIAWIQKLTAFIAIDFAVTFNVPESFWTIALVVVGIVSLLFFIGILGLTSFHPTFRKENKARVGTEFKDWAEKDQEAHKTILLFKYVFNRIGCCYQANSVKSPK